MQVIPLSAIPNQSFNIQLDNINYDFTVRFTVNFMSVDVVRDSIPIISGMRSVPGTPLIPYRYLESGNFVFVTANDEYPIYTQFGVTQFLLYASMAEIEALRE